MRTNGFALFKGPAQRECAEKAATAVERFCREVVVTREDFAETTVVAYSLDDEGSMPVVHGFLEGEDETRDGEFSAVIRVGDKLVATRDILGTRPLYLGRDGSSLASDHRLLGSGCASLPNGATVEFGSADVRTTPIQVAEVREQGLDACAEAVARLLTEAVDRRVKGRRKVAVSFSGGLDSSLIALLASRKASVVLCSAFASGSRDQGVVSSAADSLGLDLVAEQVDDAVMSRELRRLDLPFEATAMDKALWCIYSTTAREASENGAELIMLGQLADELFGGYMKYARKATESEAGAAEMMRTDVLESGRRAFVRDEAACARFTEVRFPYADGALASAALGIPLRYKIADGERKVVLRRAASLLGLPDALVNAPKKAAQYSSGVAKLVHAGRE